MPEIKRGGDFGPRLFCALTRTGDPGPTGCPASVFLRAMYRPRERRIDLSMIELRVSSVELAEALHSLRWLLRDPEDPEMVFPSEKRPRGRPRRGDVVNPDSLREAPVPELAVAAAQEVSPIVTKIHDPDLLEEALVFERENDGRKSVIEVIERRLRALRGRGPAGALSAPQGQEAPSSRDRKAIVHGPEKRTGNSLAEAADRNDGNPGLGEAVTVDGDDQKSRSTGL